MLKTKPWYTSKTIWASIVAILAAGLSYLGHPIDEVTQAQLAENLLALVGILGSMTAIWGRLSADQVIGS